MKAIVTGHTRGLGGAIADALLARGIPVLGLARGTRADAALLEQHAIDLADAAALAHWIDGDGLSRFLSGSRTVLLVNNAGVVQPIGPLGTQGAAAVARAVAANVAAPLMLADAVGALRDADDRRILHMSSGAGATAYPGWSVYCATKAALDHHARAAWQDGSANLRICSLAPGVIDTDMQAEIRATPPGRFPIRERFEELKRNGALSSAADCAARVVDYLLDDAFGQAPTADLRTLRPG